MVCQISQSRRGKGQRIAKMDQLKPSTNNTPKVKKMAHMEQLEMAEKLLKTQ